MGDGERKTFIGVDLGLGPDRSAAVVAEVDAAGVVHVVDVVTGDPLERLLASTKVESVAREFNTWQSRVANPEILKTSRDSLFNREYLLSPGPSNREANALAFKIAQVYDLLAENFHPIARRELKTLLVASVFDEFVFPDVELAWFRSVVDDFLKSPGLEFDTVNLEHSADAFDATVQRIVESVERKYKRAK